SFDSIQIVNLDTLFKPIFQGNLSPIALLGLLKSLPYK
ncbi:hypothetical protein MNBD_GAMMA04-1286, partial [hydrothermal vent metagenome]